MSATQNTATIRVRGRQVILTLSGPDGSTAALFTPEGAEEMAQHLADAAAAARLHIGTVNGPDRGPA